MADARDWYVDGQIEVREGRAGEPTMLSGYAAVFGQETIIETPESRWRERIAPTAFDDVLGRADTIAAVNHDSKMVLGRSRAGTLKLTVDRIGLRYDVKLPNTSLARDTVENVRNGNYSGSSFKFKATRDGIRVDRPRNADDLPLIVIERVVDLIDVGPVTFPAYDGTAVSVRESIKDMLAEHDSCVKALADVAIRERLRTRIAIECAKAW
jgi:HK97 family phage prohead protease